MYVITGSTGNTGKRIAEALLAAGKQVKAIARNPEKLAPLATLGAEIAVGDITDIAFMTQALSGAEAAYLMIPPNFATDNWPAYLENTALGYAQAVRDSGVKKVVMLSSIGAHRTEGVGPIGGLGKMELALRAIPGIDVLALRPGYFMENFYASVGMIQHAGINGGVQLADVPFALVHTRDIAQVATERLLTLDFTGFSHEFIVGPADSSMREVTVVIGKNIGKPELPYIEFSSADGKAGMIQAGLPETIASGYVEMAEGINNGYLAEGYEHAKATAMPTSLEWFVENELKGAFV